jgi:hypothetical protein
MKGGTMRGKEREDLARPAALREARRRRAKNIAALQTMSKLPPKKFFGPGPVRKNLGKIAWEVPVRSNFCAQEPRSARVRGA